MEWTNWLPPFPLPFDMNFTTSQMKNDVAKLPWRSRQIPLNDYDSEVTSSCCSNLINGYYMTFSDMVFGFGYLLLWHYSCLPLFIFASVLYLSPIWRQKSDRKKSHRNKSKMICFMIDPPCPVWLACYAIEVKYQVFTLVPFYH